MNASTMSPKEEQDLGVAQASSTTATNNNNNDTPSPSPLDKKEDTAPTTTATASASNDNENDNDSAPSCLQRLVAFYFANEFLILIITAILLARAYPPIGAEYLAPEITATWLAVCIIFVMAGLGLKTEEFKNAFGQIWFNLTIQLYNFGVVSSVVYGVTRGLEAANILSKDLADGMVIGASLPMTINMVLVLTKSSGGDESLAIVNAAAGNMVGVFLSPILILGYLGVTGDVDLIEVFYKLALRVVLPVAVGQIIQKKMPKVVAYYKANKKYFKKLQEYCLVFIVYTVFCRTFEDESDSSIGDIFLMIVFVFLFLTTFMAVAWQMLGLLYGDKPKMRVMGLYGCTHKTVAMGVPLINAIYEDNPSVGLYTLPLLIWHPMQLVIGTFLSPRLAAFVESEERRLGIKNEDDEDEDEAGAADAETGTAAATLTEGAEKSNP